MRVEPPPGNVWTKITIPVSFRYAMTVLNDPVRPSDYYGFVTDGDDSPIRVLKSGDFGASWTVINETRMLGDPWGGAIDPDPKRDPGVPPVLYTPAGFGNRGLFRSMDGGVRWTQLFASAKDNPFASVTPLWPPHVYSVTALPDSIDHVLVTFHREGGVGWSGTPDAGFGESMDGGASWTLHMPSPGMGASQYLVILDRRTWLSVSENNGGSGTWLTTTAGRVAGQVTPAAWRRVDDFEHVHGAFHPAIMGDSAYLPGPSGIRCTRDRGQTWDFCHRTNEGGAMSTVVATGHFLYADWVMGPSPLRTPIDDGTRWAPYTAAPLNMRGGLGPGTRTIAASSDGTRWYIVNFDNDGGVWRYVEE